jgi:hypothetical protein
MKKYVAALVIGSAALMIVLAVLHRQRTAPPAREQPSSAAATAENLDGTASTFTGNPPAPDSSDDARPRELDATPSVALDTAPEATQEAEGPCDCELEWIRRKQARLEATQATEAKDAAWAYETEQLLEQFIADDPAAQTIELAGVDCRTTYCEIDATVPSDASGAFEAVVARAISEPWNTLSGYRARHSTFRDDGQLDLQVVLERASTGGDAVAEPASSDPSEDDGCACATPQWQERHAMPVTAAPPHESKDVQWAYATEQQLQRLIAARAQATTLQVSSIDCWTTYCEVKAIGLTDEAAGALLDIVREAVAQNQLGLGGEMWTDQPPDGEIVATFTRLR